MTIGYLQAWQDWFSGREIDPQARLWFIPILWWGRAGKIGSFIGGATVVLDLIGPDRLRRFGRRVSGPGANWLMTRLVLPITCVLAVTVALAAVMDIGRIWTNTRDTTLLAATVVSIAIAFGGWLVVVALHYGPAALSRLLDHERPAQALRYIGVALLITGLHFDLLAS